MVFSPTHALDPDNSIPLPCGRCIGCRLEYSRQWAIRCMHEGQLYDNNCFLTLTYDEDNLPDSNSLYHRDFQLFMKTLRKEFVPKNPYNKKLAPKTYEYFRRKYWIRYYMCGEYGQQCSKCKSNELDCICSSGFEAELGRPHYHVCLFNFDFPDKQVAEQNGKKGDILYNSKILEKHWPYGFCNIGSLTWESAAYVARYITKKITGDNAHDHYQSIDLLSGESRNILPEYTRMSRDPGIAKPWYEKFKGDLEKGYITVNGKKVSPAKYYDKCMEIDDWSLLDHLKDLRKQKAMEMTHLNTPERLATKEYIKLRKTKQLKRGLT